MARLLILSCSQRKLPTPTPLPALDRYDGPFFRVLRRYLRSAPLPHPDVFILSARYGLIPASQPIADYDQRLTLDRALHIRPAVLQAFRLLLAERAYSGLFICAGSVYLTALDGFSLLVPPETLITQAEGTIGRMQGILKDWLHGSAHLPAEAPIPGLAQGRAQLCGIELVMSAEQVLQLARQASTAGQGHPERYQSWYVPLDGQRVSPKWLVSQLTGLPTSAFVTEQARRVLAQLGVEVRRV